MAATTTKNQKDFSAEDLETVKRFRDAEIAAEQKARDLTIAASVRRNETGRPLASRGCTSGATDIEKRIRCDGLDAFCKRDAAVAPYEPFVYPRAHRVAALTAEMPEVDEAIAASEGTFQARIALGKLRETLNRSEEAAAKATWNLNDKRETLKIIVEAIAQQEQECTRRSAHVDAAQKAIDSFLGQYSEAARACLLAGKAEASLEAVKRAADEAERRRLEVHTVDDLKRAQAGAVEPPAYAMGAGGQPVKLKVERQRW